MTPIDPTGPSLLALDQLTREQLEQRRNELHVQLAAVNDRLQAHLRARRATIGPFHADAIEPDEGATLDPSE